MYELFCCGDQGDCEGYKRGERVCFSYIKSEEGGIDPGYEDFPLRWIFLLSGKMLIRKGEEERIMLEGGEMCLLPSKEYTVMAVGEVEWIYFVSDRPTEYCMKVVEDLTAGRQKKDIHLVKVGIRTPVDYFLQVMKLYLQTGINCERLFEEKQEEIFIVLLSKYPHDELGDFLYSLTLHQHNDLKKFVTANCWRAKNVTELAEICGYSVSGFKRVFKQLFNESIYRWMQQQKAERLSRKLEEEEVNLKELYNEFGFSSPAHFTKFCKQWLGVTPTRYVEEAQKRRNTLKL